MKKFLNQLFIFAALGSVALLTSCGGKDDEEVTPSPTISVELASTSAGTLDGDVITVNSGETLIFDIDITAPGGFNTFRVLQDNDIVAEHTRTDLSLDAGTTVVPSFTQEVILTAQTDTQVTLEFVAVDDIGTGQTSSESYTVNIIASPQARSYTAILLNVPTADKTSTAFFSSTDGEIYSPQQVTSTQEAISPKIDFGYYYGQTDNASLASPAGFATLSNTAFSSQVDGWSTLNDINFRSTGLTSSDFIELSTYADIDDVYDNGTDAGGIITTLSVGDVIAFETDADKTGGSKRGIILVQEINGTFNQNDNIKLDILIQEPAN